MGWEQWFKHMSTPRCNGEPKLPSTLIEIMCTVLSNFQTWPTPDECVTAFVESAKSQWGLSYCHTLKSTGRQSNWVSLAKLTTVTCNWMKSMLYTNWPTSYLFKSFEIIFKHSFRNL
jgi:hypothetical protein